MKKQLLFILLLVLQSFVVFIPSNNVLAAENPEGYVIEGDSVVWENDWARLEVWPHTSYEILTHVQYANLTWKLADNDIDVAFRFDVPISNGKIWRKSGDDWIPVSMYLTEYGGKYYYRHNNFHVVQDSFYQFKWQYSLPVNTSGKWELLGKLSSDTIQEAYSSGRYIMLDPWWDGSWTNYRLLTISNTYIDTDLSNFPVLVNISATISADCDDGNSIRFLNTDNTTEYYYEIEGTWNAASYNFVWVNITSISSSSDTKFLMYYGNDAASDNQNKENVWNSGYKVVSHLNTSDSTTTVIDSTSGHNNGTKLGNAEPSQTIGKIGYGQNYDGDDDNISYGNIGDTFYGFSIWIRPAAEINKDSDCSDFLDIRTDYLFGDFGSCTGTLADETFTFLKETGGATRIAMTENITVGWHMLSASWDGNQFQIYLDGVNLTEITSGVTPQQTITSLTLGNFSGTTPDIDVDEFRVSIVKRNDSWMKATFNSGNQTPGFLTFGLEMVNVAVETNATTGIEETNATLHGYIFGVGNGNYNYGFWIGTTTPLTEGNADRNMTGIGTVTTTGDGNFSHIDSNLSRGVHYYVRTWIRNSTYWTSSSDEDDFWTKCDAPSGFTSTFSGYTVTLTWIKGTGADKTTVVRKADSYPTSLTDGTVIYNDTGSTYPDTTGGGSHQYYRAWSWAGDKHSDENASTNIDVPLDAPTGFTATLDDCNVDLAWTKGDGADKTTIRRKVDSYPANTTDGTVVYNNTGTSYSDTIGGGSHQYYRAWSWAGDKHSDGNASVNLSVPPCPPTNVTGNILANTTLNISWVKGIGASTTLVVRKADSSPSSETDGTIIFNDTILYVIESDLTQNYFYRLWSYANQTYSSSVALEYGALVVSCFDEITNESIDFDILVNNQDGTETYESLNNTNSLLINVADLPLGDNIRIQISATSDVINKTQVFSGYANNTNTTITQVILLQDPNSKSATNVTTTNTTSGINSYPQFTLDGDIITIPASAVDEFDQITVTYQHNEYEPRTYFRDFIANQVFVLNAYLPNADDSELYRVSVEDDFGNTVNDALVIAKVSVGGNFVIASSLLTDGNGNIDIFLLPGITYLFSISKTGYITTYGTWTPSIAAFIKTFKIVAEDTNITTVTFGDLITFTGEWVTANNTLRVYFNDKDDNTTDVTFSVYESYGVYLNLTNRSAFESITTVTLYFSGLNTSRMHQIRLEMNHTTLGYILNQTIYVSPIRDDDRISESWLDSIIALVMGNFDYGYVAFALIYFPCILLIISLGAIKQPGFGVLLSGLYIILVTWRVDVSNTFMFALSSLLILFGVIMVIVKHGKKLTGKETT